MTTVAVTRASRNMPALGYGDYLRFNHLIQDRCGLYFPDSRRSGFEQGVLRAFAASPCIDLNTYYRLLLDADKGDAYFDQLVNALTTNETYFFRDAGQFDALYKHVLPQIIARRRSMRSLRIWSVGCASGEEPYSIAMLLRELIPDINEWSITILGSDMTDTVSTNLDLHFLEIPAGSLGLLTGRVTFSGLEYVADDSILLAIEGHQGVSGDEMEHGAFKQLTHLGARMNKRESTPATSPFQMDDRLGIVPPCLGAGVSLLCQPTLRQLLIVMDNYSGGIGEDEFKLTVEKTRDGRLFIVGRMGLTKGV